MRKFVELDTSIFDPDFTLNPYPYLEDMYQQDDVIGFTSEGMQFIFKFADCRAVMYAKNFQRGTDDPECFAREEDYARRYIHRARHLENHFAIGVPNLKLKALVTRMINAIATQAEFASVDSILARLSIPGRLDDYIDEITTVPLRLFLETAGIPHDESDLQKIHFSGCQFIKGFEAFNNEKLIRLMDDGSKVIQEFVASKLESISKDALIYPFIEEARASGFSEDNIAISLMTGPMIDMSNTFGITSAFVLRSLITHKTAWQTLQNNPELIWQDNVIQEIFRLDNHVKVLSRQAFDGVDLPGYHFQKGQSVSLFFPGLNRDPAQWTTPHQLGFTRVFDNKNNLIFGGSVHTCIGVRLSNTFLKYMLSDLLKYMPASIEVIELEIEVDGSWLAERIITKMPIKIG
jgi:cytochrome P450